MLGLLRTYRFLAVTLAGLLLVTSTGVAADLHFCGGELQGFSLLGEAKSCHEQDIHPAQPACHKAAYSESLSAADTDCQKDCCHNELVFAQLDGDFTPPVKAEFGDLTPLQPVTVCAVWVSGIQGVPAPQRFYLSYKPPRLFSDIPVVTGSFLI